MGLKRIFVNGTFDLLHRGHVELLNFAATLGDQVWVAIDSDRRVSELKGPTRPIINQKDRKYLLESLRSVSIVLTFDSDEQLDQIIKGCNPAIMVKGSDYQGKSIIGAEHCGEIVFFERLSDYATTKTIQDLTNR